MILKGSKNVLRFLSKKYSFYRKEQVHVYRCGGGFRKGKIQKYNNYDQKLTG